MTLSSARECSRFLSVAARRMRASSLAASLALFLAFSAPLTASGNAPAERNAPTAGDWEEKEKGEGSTKAEYRPGMLLVKFKHGLRRASCESVHATLGAKRSHSFRYTPVDVVTLPAGLAVDQAVDAYQSRPEVVYAEPNYELRALAVPNDPRFGELWGMNNTGQTGGTPDADIDAPEAWDAATGSAGVVVGVIDTGVDYVHQDLAANMWTNPAELGGAPGVDDDGNGIVDDIYGARWTNGNGTVTNGNPMDGHGHGTHCSGTIGGVGNNGVGVAGVNWTVRIMALKFLDDAGQGATADAISAIEYAIDKGAHFTSNSWGGGGYSQALKDAIAAAGAANQLFIAAAGNDGLNNDASPHYPSSYNNANIVAAAASDRNDARSIFTSGGSNYGATSVDVAAPGSSILSALPGNKYGSWSGTSMATPHVSGVAALLLSQHAGTPHQTLKNWILQGATPLAAWGGVVATGARLNAAESMRLAALPAYAQPVGSFSAASGQGANTVNLSWTNPTDARFTQAIVRRGASQYPSRWDQGGAVYAGAASSFVDGPLAAGQTYYYSIWAQYGESACYSALAKAKCVVGDAPDDWYSEIFAASDNDLDNWSLTFTPDGSADFYSVSGEEATSFPTDPAGGSVLALADDSSAMAVLGAGAQVALYGAHYGAFYVGSNGYVTFGSADSDWTESLSDHFAIPRISMAFDDLNPAAGGLVSWKQLWNRAVVTYQNVPEFRTGGGGTGSSSFQIEMFFDGRIRLTWLGLTMADGLAGLSAGAGLPSGFAESDLSAYAYAPSVPDAPCHPLPADGAQGVAVDTLLSWENELTPTPAPPPSPSCREDFSGGLGQNWAAIVPEDWTAASPVEAGTLAYSGDSEDAGQPFVLTPRREIAPRSPLGEMNVRDAASGAVYAGISDAVASGASAGFPFDDSSVVGSLGVVDSTKVGWFWSASRGDGVTQTFASAKPSIDRAAFDLVVPRNTLNGGARVEWTATINGVAVGNFAVVEGQTGPVRLAWSFDPIAGPDYTVRFAVVNDVPQERGGHTLGYAGAYAGAARLVARPIYDVYFRRAGSMDWNPIYSGSNTSCPVPSLLDMGIEYEWYAVASNDAGSESGPIWSFKTEKGRLKGVILPAEALSLGAKWRVMPELPDYAGTEWLDSGAVVNLRTTLPAANPANYRVGFKDLPGYKTPAIMSAPVADYVLKTVTRTYSAGLQVDILPVGAVAAGAQWRVAGKPDFAARPWRPSGYVEVLPPGDYVIRFKDLPDTGWKNPSTQSVRVFAGVPTFAEGTYAAGLTCSILPPQAIANGAQWRIVGIGGWTSSGVVATGLAAGPYTVRFRDAAGWIKPPNQTATFAPGQPLVFTGTYAPAAP